jgi:hypothetical protein
MLELFSFLFSKKKKALQVAVLFGFFGGAWSLDGFDYDRNFLVNVGRGRGFRAVDDFFDDSDLGILVVFLTMLSLHGAEDDDGKDKEHPEENSNSAAKDEGDGSTLPTTQIHDGVMNAINEGSFSKVVVSFVVVVTAVAVMSMVGGMTIMRCIDTNEFNGSLRIFTVNSYETAGSADER